MGPHAYKSIEITGSSEAGSDDAVRNAIAKASESVRHIHWFEVIGQRGYVEDGVVRYWQVTVKVGFRLED